jgi:SOS-response transcriptional repressor LexA
LKTHIFTFKKQNPFRVLRYEDVKPYVNSVPLIDISAAAGNFSDLQIHSDFEWIELPFNIVPQKGHFVCKVVGESMNKRIPNNSFCLFRIDEGGSRNGKIVLVELYNKQDSESGSRFTVKEYHSKKSMDQNQWTHQSITLKPLSENSEYIDIELDDDELSNLKVVGIFECVLQ